MDNKQIFAKNLNRLMKAENKSRRDVCEALNISYYTFSDWANAKKYPRMDKVELLANYFGVAKSDLIEDKDTISLPDGIMPLPQTVKKPRLGTIACGKPVLAVEEAEQWDAVPEGIDCDFTLECKGDSMINARIFPGDIVYIKAQPIVENGEIAAVLIGEETTLKKVYYNNASDRIVLQPCNPLYSDMVYSGSELDEIKILGKAVAFLSKVRV